MKKVASFIKHALRGNHKPLLSGPLLVIVHFRLPLPMYMKKARREMRHTFPHTVKPDADNLEKFLNDSLKGQLWDDDSRISWMLRSKSYTKNKEGSTTIFVRELPEFRPNYDEILADIVEHLKIEDVDEGQITAEEENETNPKKQVQKTGERVTALFPNP